MPELKIGELFTLKSHPNFAYSEAIIGGDADFTPPILVVCEYLNNDKEYQTEDGMRKANQVRGIFYSSKTHKYEKYWFKRDEIVSLPLTDIEGSPLVGKGQSKHQLKLILRNKLVILSSVEYELSKIRIREESKNFESKNYKQNPFLNFVPPVMTVIDVRETEVLKNNYSKRTGDEKRKTSRFELKCKYYNPLSSIYSEEWIPLECLYDITQNFIKPQKNLTAEDNYPIDIDKEIQFEDRIETQVKTIIKFRKIIFNHYKYIIIAENIFTKELIKLKRDELTNLLTYTDEQLFGDKEKPDYSANIPFPSAIFRNGDLYKIIYLSETGKKSERVIIINGIENLNNNDFIIIANCLLRRGEIRHFRGKNIKEIRRANEILKSLFSKAVSKRESKQ